MRSGRKLAHVPTICETRHIPGRSDKITLILPVLIIHHDHQLAILYILNGALDTCQHYIN